MPTSRVDNGDDGDNSNLFAICLKFISKAHTHTVTLTFTLRHAPLHTHTLYAIIELIKCQQLEKGPQC